MRVVPLGSDQKLVRDGIFQAVYGTPALNSLLPLRIMPVIRTHHKGCIVKSGRKELKKKKDLIQPHPFTSEDTKTLKDLI